MLGDSCSSFRWDDTSKCIVADDRVYEEWVKTYPKCAGLNRKPFPYFDQLARIFREDMATGNEAESATDRPSEVQVISAVNVEDVDDDYSPNMASDEESGHQVLKDMINQGVGLNIQCSQDNPNINVDNGRNKSTATTSSNKRARLSQADIIMNAVVGDLSKLRSILEKTSVHIERIANRFCAEDELVIRRKTVYEEVSKIDGLTEEQVISAARMLVKDDRKAQLYYQLPDDAMRLKFLQHIIQ